MIGSVNPLAPHRVPPPPEPNYDTNSICEIFKYFAKNPARELLGRYQEAYHGLKITPEQEQDFQQNNLSRLAKGKKLKTRYRVYVNSIVITMCGVVRDGLMLSLLGKNYNSQQKSLDPDPKKAIAELKSTIVDQEAFVDENHWTVYSILISGDSGHAFLLLQTKEGCKIYQSFLEKYTLNDYLVRHDNSLSQPLLFLMLDEILEYVTSPIWNDQMDHLFKHFFKAPQKAMTGDQIHYSRSLTIEWCQVTREQVKQQAAAFQAAFPPNLEIEVRSTCRNNDSDHIFRIFRRFADNLPKEIVARRSWLEDRLTPDFFIHDTTGVTHDKSSLKGASKVKVAIPESWATSSTMTLEALMVANFGKYYKSPTKRTASIQELALETNTLEQFKQTILTNEKQITNYDHWYVYGLAMEGGRGHGCTIVQALKNGEVTYKLYQSVQDHYSMKTGLDKYNSTYTNVEIFLLLDEIIGYVNSTHWNAQNEHLFTHFFHSKFPGQIGAEIGYQPMCKATWGLVNSEFFKKTVLEFEADFPKFIKFIF